MSVCKKCLQEFEDDCFRKGQDICVWCQFKDPENRAGHRFNDKKKEKRWKIKTKKEFVDWYLEQDDECYYCGITFDDLRSLRLNRFRGKYVSWDIDRKNNCKPYTVDNIVLSCFLCNTVKGSVLNENETKKIGKAIGMVYKDKLKKNEQSRVSGSHKKLQ